MKTAEQWYVEEVGRGDMGWNVELSEHEYMDHVKQIQLDAIKEGMRRAALVMYEHYYNNPGTSDAHLEQAIFTASEQLTEKDL